MTYLLLKWIHILSATLLLGTGLGSAFLFFVANRRKDTASIYFAARHVVLADWVFIAPAVVVQLVTGIWMVEIAGYGWTDGWILWGLILYLFVGACWLPVVWMQIKMRDIAKQALDSGSDLPAGYWSLHRWWLLLGTLAFPAVIAVFYLMVMKPV